MRTAIAAVLALTTLVGVAGCESNAQPGATKILGYQVDAARNRSVWLTREGVQIHGAAMQPVSVGLPGWLYAGAPHCPPAVALGPAGEIVVTSNVIPTLWRIDAETFVVTEHPLVLDSDQDKDVGFAAMVYAPEQRAYIAYSDTQRSLWKVDASLRTAVKLAATALERPRQAKARSATCADLARRLAQPRID